MSIYVDTEQEALRTITLPPGPAILYVTEGDRPTVTILDKAPAGNLPKGRDLVLCRALLDYVLDQLNEAAE